MKALLRLLVLLTLGAFAAACSDNATVNPGTAPTINFFTATPASIGPGESARLAWSIEGAPTSVTIDNSVGDVSSTTTKTLFPVATTTYMLSAKNENGTVTKRITVSVDNPSDPGAPPIPVELVATPGNPGVINLSWPLSTGAATYQLERRTGNGAFVLVSDLVGDCFFNMKLLSGTTFTYRVRAVASSGAHSGWSRYATARVPGVMPVVSRISLTPTTPSTLKPGQSVQFTAVAYDASDNDLHLAQDIFIWQSSNPSILSINGVGTATAGSQFGSAAVTAIVGTMQSNVVDVSVGQRMATVLAIFHPRNSADVDYSLYEGALNFTGVAYDKITDNISDHAPAFTFDQIKNYRRIFFLTRYNNALNSATIEVLKKYLDLPGKRLVIISQSSLFSNDAGFRSYIGLDKDGHMGIIDIASTVTGGDESSMQGFTCQRLPVMNYVSDLKLIPRANTFPALISRSVSDGSTVIVAMESTLSNGSKIFYSGLLLKNMNSDMRAMFMSRLTSIL